LSKLSGAPQLAETSELLSQSNNTLVESNSGDVYENTTSETSFVAVASSSPVSRSDAKVFFEEARPQDTPAPILVSTPRFPILYAAYEFLSSYFGSLDG
jgi:hypothetical protein